MYALDTELAGIAAGSMAVRPIPRLAILRGRLALFHIDNMHMRRATSERVDKQPANARGVELVAGRQLRSCVKLCGIGIVSQPTDRFGLGQNRTGLVEIGRTTRRACWKSVAGVV